MKYFDTSADVSCQGLGFPKQRSVHMLYLWTSKGGVSAAGDNLAQSTVEDGESSSVSEKAAEEQVETQKSSFVTRVCNSPAVVNLEQLLSHTHPHPRQSPHAGGEGKEAFSLNSGMVVVSFVQLLCFAGHQPSPPAQKASPEPALTGNWLKSGLGQQFLWMWLLPQFVFLPVLGVAGGFSYVGCYVNLAVA